MDIIGGDRRTFPAHLASDTTISAGVPAAATVDTLDREGRDYAAHYSVE